MGLPSCSWRGIHNLCRSTLFMRSSIVLRQSLFAVRSSRRFYASTETTNAGTCVSAMLLAPYLSQCQVVESLAMSELRTRQLYSAPKIMISDLALQLLNRDRFPYRDRHRIAIAKVDLAKIPLNDVRPFVMVLAQEMPRRSSSCSWVRCTSTRYAARYIRQRA